jgi:hypothetical protein
MLADKAVCVLFDGILDFAALLSAAKVLLAVCRPM